MRADSINGSNIRRLSDHCERLRYTRVEPPEYGYCDLANSYYESADLSMGCYIEVDGGAHKTKVCDNFWEKKSDCWAAEVWVDPRTGGLVQ